MPSLLDLNSECLRLCGSYLSDEDFRSLLVVSKGTNFALSVDLCSRLVWQFGDTSCYAFDITEESRTLRCTRVTGKGHELAELMIQNPSLAPKIKDLHLLCDWCQVCTPRWAPGWIWVKFIERLTCQLLDAALLSQFTSLRTLRLHGFWEKLLPHIGSLPRLTSLQLGDAMSTSHREEQVLSLDLLWKTLRHPRLRRLEVYAINIRNEEQIMPVSGGASTLTFPRPTTDAPSLRLFHNDGTEDTENALSTALEQLILIDVEVNKQTLDEILIKSKLLTSLTLKRTKLRWDEVYSAILKKSTTLERLSLTEVSRKPENDRHTDGQSLPHIADTRRMGSLEFFTKLNTLIIDPPALIGRVECPNGPLAPVPLPPISLASNLPDGLQNLTLVTSLQQAYLMKGLRTDILQDILQEQIRLASLEKVTFLEMAFLQPDYPGDTYGNCQCPNNNSKCRPEDPYIFTYKLPVRMTRRETLDVYKVADTCRQAGIAVEVVDEDEVDEELRYSEDLIKV